MKWIYFLLRRALSQNSRDKIKPLVHRARARFSGLRRLAYGRFDAREVIGEVVSRIDRDVEILMVHSSLGGLLPMYSGTPVDLLRELIRFCDGRITLAMPAFFFGKDGVTPKEYFESHRFDARKTMSQMGLLTEVFRRSPNVKRSLHPTHSVCALGPLAEELVRHHHLAGTMTGDGTPFGVMAAHSTAIIGVGVFFYRCLTQVHAAEDILGSAFPVDLQHVHRDVEIVDETGAAFTCRISLPGNDRLARRRRPDILRSLLEKKDLVEWRFHGAPLFITYADRVTRGLMDAAAKGVTIYGRTVRGPGDQAEAEF